jgi:hypothetical protein
MVYLKGQDNWHEIEFSESGTGAGAATDVGNAAELAGWPRT